MTTSDQKKHPVLNFFSLSDQYARTARFLPAVLTVMVGTPVALAYGIKMVQYLTLITTGVGIGAVLAVGISHLASALGNRFQQQLWPDWPFDAPTHRWLMPGEAEKSGQQQQQWYSAIKSVTGIDIQAVVDSGDQGELRRAINDAVATIRSRLWKLDCREADLVRLRNIEYGYARNFTGLRVIWIPISLLSCGGCWAAWWFFDGELLWLVLSSAIMCVLLPTAFWVLPSYVRQKADYYAHAFFSGLEFLSSRESGQNSTLNNRLPE